MAKPSVRTMVQTLYAYGDGEWDASRIMRCSARCLRHWRSGSRKPSAARLARLRAVYERLMREDTSVWELRHRGPFADAD